MNQYENIELQQLHIDDNFYDPQFKNSKFVKNSKLLSLLKKINPYIMIFHLFNLVIISMSIISGFISRNEDKCNCFLTLSNWLICQGIISSVFLILYAICDIIYDKIIGQTNLSANISTINFLLVFLIVIWNIVGVVIMIRYYSYGTIISGLSLIFSIIVTPIYSKQIITILLS